MFQIESDGGAIRLYSRKDFYKICLTTGKSVIHYADRSFEEEGSILFFGNPHIPYSWETLSTTYVGYTCLFSEEFLKTDPMSSGGTSRTGYSVINVIYRSIYSIFKKHVELQ